MIADKLFINIYLYIYISTIVYLNSKPSTYYRCRIPFKILGIWIIEGRLTCTIYVRQRLIILVPAYKSLHRGPTNHFKQPHFLPPIPFNSLLPLIFTVNCILSLKK